MINAPYEASPAEATEFHRREAARLRELGEKAATAADKLLHDAEEHERIAKRRGADGLILT